MQLSIAEIYDRISAAQGSVPAAASARGCCSSCVVIGVLFLIIQALALVVGLALARSITGSVHELFAGTERVRQGDFTHKIAIRAHDQLGELAASFNSMTGSIEDLLREQAEKKRLEEELRIAHEIQMSLLPQGPLQHARAVGDGALRAGARGRRRLLRLPPARRPSRRRADRRRLRQGHLGGALHGGAEGADAVAEPHPYLAARSADRGQSHHREHLDARSFITMTYAVLDLRARTMTYARAGHTPLIYLPATGTRTAHLRVLAPDGLVLGLKIDDGEMFERLLREETMTIHEGDLFLFFTDGITEAMNAGDDCFGEVAARADSSRSTRTCPAKSCASGCCARSPRSSATRRSTTT